MEQGNTTQVRDLVMRERAMAVSDREWKHRLRGYGYTVRDTSEGGLCRTVAVKSPASPALQLRRKAESQYCDAGHTRWSGNRPSPR